MKYILKTVLLLAITIIHFQTLGETLHPRGSIGIVLNVGSAINRIGFTANGNIGYNHFQSNIRIAAQYNLKHWGSNTKTPEIQFGAGIIWAYGSRDSLYHNMDLVSNQTPFSNSIGYAWNFYFDKNGSSQRNGIIGLQLKKCRIVTENDILAETSVDKFRTAAALVSYNYQQIDYAIKLLLWTGNYKAPESIRIKTDTLSWARFGYYDVSKTSHGKQSHGIICIQAHKTFEYGQQAKAMFGIDAEQVRNIFQNKLMHDAFFMPRWMITYKNLHYPMIDSEGNIYLHNPSQKIRKIKPFINISANDNIFY